MASMEDKRPLYAVSDNVSRTIGRDAQRNNILAAKIIADIVKTTLGPKGMDKMLVDSAGNIIITNDGVTILEEMEIDHPAAKMMVDIAKTQETEAGDGTTTAALLAGKLLENAESLLDKGIHPTIITKGYKIAADKSENLLSEISMPVKDSFILRNVAMTAMTGKGSESYKEKLAGLLVQAIERIAEGKEIDSDCLKIHKIKGKSVEESSLIQGIILDKEKTSADMPSKIEDAKILLADFAIEVRNPETETRISVSTPEQLENFIASEEIYLRKITDRIISSGANVLFCQKGIDDMAQHHLSRAGIMAFRRISKSDIEKIAKGTEARVVSNINDVNSHALGYADSIEQLLESNENMTFIKGCKNNKVFTLILRGSTEHVVDEIERSVKDGLGDVVSAIRMGKVVAGGGATEIELSRRLRSYARTIGGREQLVIEKFADSLESVPETLAVNAGLDSLDILTEMKKKHEAGDHNAGLNLFNDKIEDAFEAGIIEPLKVKLMAIRSASEVASLILRIDDVLISKGKPSTNREESYEGMD